MIFQQKPNSQFHKNCLLWSQFMPGKWVARALWMGSCAAKHDSQVPSELPSLMMLYLLRTQAFHCFVFFGFYICSVGKEFLC